MEQNDNIEALKEYIDRIREILTLSSPQVEEIDNAEDYRVSLLRAFTRVGELAHLNNDVLDRHFYSMMDHDGLLSDQVIETMRAFCALLIDTTSMENIDHPVLHRQAERILEQAQSGNSLREKILAWDGMVISAYMMINLTLRLYPDFDICFHYRDIGLSAAKELLAYLDRERFAALPDDECRELVLINSRYIRSLFEWGDRTDMAERNEEDLRLMRRALEIAEDPFYREAAPAYNWDIHVFRTLQYLADFTEYHNRHGFTADQLKEIAGYTKRLSTFLDDHPALAEGCPETERSFYLLRNSFLTGELETETYKSGLLDLMKTTDTKDYSARSMFVNFIIPFEFILTLDRNALSEAEEAAVRDIYAGMTGYAYHMPKTGVLSFMLTFLSEVLKEYIEVEGGRDFESMCLALMAAMHPPTYIHSLSVSSFCVFLAEKLMDKEPQRFTGMCGAKTASEVLEKRTEILDFIRHGALLHDVGKLFVVETIITYGRRLLDEEFSLIKAHPVVGASLLEQIPATRKYAEAARGHHKWYNNRGGYPADFDMTQAEQPALLALLSVADCLDAATDAVGRCYKPGKNLDEFIAELRAGSGTCYAPYVVALFDDSEVRAGVETLLMEVRDENYRRTYHILKEL